MWLLLTLFDPVPSDWQEEPITSLGKELLLYPCGQQDQLPDYLELFEWQPPSGSSYSLQLGFPLDKRHRNIYVWSQKHPAAEPVLINWKHPWNPHWHLSSAQILEFDVKRKWPLLIFTPKVKGEDSQFQQASVMKGMTLMIHIKQTKKWKPFRNEGVLENQYLCELSYDPCTPSVSSQEVSGACQVSHWLWNAGQKKKTFSWLRWCLKHTSLTVHVGTRIRET